MHRLKLLRQQREVIRGIPPGTPAPELIKLFAPRNGRQPAARIIRNARNRPLRQGGGEGVGQCILRHARKSAVFSRILRQFPDWFPDLGRRRLEPIGHFPFGQTNVKPQRANSGPLAFDLLAIRIPGCQSTPAHDDDDTDERLARPSAVRSRKSAATILSSQYPLTVSARLNRSGYHTISVWARAMTPANDVA